MNVSLSAVCFSAVRAELLTGRQVQSDNDEFSFFGDVMTCLLISFLFDTVKVNPFSSRVRNFLSCAFFDKPNSATHSFTRWVKPLYIALI